MLKKAVIAIDCLLVLLAILAMALDHNDGQQLALWISVALLASAQLWKHLAE